MAVARDQRHTKRNPCPICGGGENDPRGREKRCDGFTTEDGDFVHCTREELAGSIPPDPNGRSYAHRMRGPCKCGQTHGEAIVHSLELVATYDYQDENGALLFQVVRFSPKTFRQRRPDGAGGWIWKLEQTQRVLYKLPDLIADDADRTVYVAEGEKDVDALASRGYLATCNPGGAGKWSTVAGAARTTLAGRDVVVIADRDSVGRAHAVEVRDSLLDTARSIRVTECPPPHKDVSDLFATGGTIDQLVDPSAEPSAEVLALAPELPFDDIWTPEPDAKLVVPGFGIAPGPAHLVAGTWYTGKTLLLATIGLCVASGRALFGLHRVQRGRWIHFDHEMGRRHLKRYVQRLRAGLGVEQEELRGMMSLRVLPRLNLRTENAIALYSEILAPFSVATIDPLRAAAPGVDENKSEFREYLDMLAIVSDRTGCAILVLHHGGKATAEPTARRNTGRGTSAIDDAVQSKFVLSAEEKGAPMLVSHEKTRELTKPLDDFYLEIVNAESAVTLTHRSVEEIGDLAAQSRNRKEAARTARAHEAVKQTLSKYAGRYQGGRDDFTKLVGGDRNAVSKAISEMLAEGLLKSEGRGEERVWYSV